MCEEVKRMFIGCHLSASAGCLGMVRTARSIGANTFAYFTRNPRGSRAKAVDPTDAAAAAELMEREGFANIAELKAAFRG